MGIFSRIKGGISSKANAAIDKATDPEKEIEMAILELEEGRKKALAELVSYKATAKQLDNDMEKQRAKAAERERRGVDAEHDGRAHAPQLAPPADEQGVEGAQHHDGEQDEAGQVR